MLFGHFCIFFREMSTQTICPFLIILFVLLTLSSNSSLYILGMNLLLDIRFAKIFSHSALGGVAQWIECQPVNQSVAGSIPSQGTCLVAAGSPVGGK